MVLYRNAAIADSDTLGVVEYKGKNGMVPSSSAPLTYNAVYSRIADASNNQIKYFSKIFNNNNYD